MLSHAPLARGQPAMFRLRAGRACSTALHPVVAPINPGRATLMGTHTRYGLLAVDG